MGNAVVAQVGAREGVAQGDGLGGAGVLVDEGAGGGHSQDIARDHVAENRVAGGDCGGVVAVVDLVLSGDTAEGDGEFVDLVVALDVGKCVVRRVITGES